MKKRILSILLAMCMLMSLLPVAAFAASTANTVSAAILHDTRATNAGGIADDDLTTAYNAAVRDATAEDGQGVNKVITLTAEGLRRHQNGADPSSMGYWAGIAITAPENVTYMKVGVALSLDNANTRFETAGSNVRAVSNEITKAHDKGFVQYLDVSSEAYEAGVFYVKLQWCDSSGNAVSGSIATVYKVDFSGVELAPATIDKVGFCAAGSDANDEVDAIIKGYGRQSGIANWDSDQNTMYIAMTDLDVSGKTYYTVKITDPAETILSTNDKNGNETVSGTIDCRKYTGPENFSVLRITLNPTNKQDNGAYVVTTPEDATPYVMKAGDYKVELYTSATEDGELTKIDTETITLNTVTIKDKAGDTTNTIFVKKDGTVKAPAAPVADTGYAFKHWSDGTETYEPNADVAVTENITLTPVFERIVAKSVTATADKATLVATPTTDLTADPATGKITITGTSTSPVAAGTTVTLEITPSIGAAEEKTFNLKYENGTLSANPAQVSIAGINYTIDVSGITLTDLPVKAVATPTPTVKEGVNSSAVSNVTVVANVTGIVNEAVAELQDIATENKDTAQEIAVYLKVEITDYDDGQSTTPKSVTLDITPVYEAKNTGDAVNPRGATPLTTTTFKTPIEIKVKLPANFVTDTTTPVVAKHLNADGSVKEELKATVTQESTDFFATFYATSFSEYTLEVDSRTVDVKFGDSDPVTYTANSVGTTLPTVVAEAGYTFQGWSKTENATTAEYSDELTFAMLDQMIAASKDADGTQSTLVLYPVITKDSTGGNNTGGSGGGSSASVSIPSASNGKVIVSNSNAKKGDTVTITLTPNDGYVVDTVTVTDAKGNTVEVSKTDDTHYTFVMPDGRVTVKATFKQADVTTPPETGFTDVAADAYYADAVKWAVDNGITNGLTATTFGPNNSCTRGQMVTFLWRAAGSPAATGTNSFADVASGEYYYNAVLWAVEKGITNGTSATTFSPNATVTRGQTVTFLYRYAESPAATGTTSFTDVTADAYYADAVKWAVAEGITNGTSDTTFAPASNCTRGQIVTFLYRQIAE